MTNQRFVVNLFTLSVVVACTNPTPVSVSKTPEHDSGRRGSAYSGVVYHTYPTVTSRKSFEWPFAVTSIWNTPLGFNAEYLEATSLNVDYGRTGFRQDEEYILYCDDNQPVMKNYAPKTGVANTNWWWANFSTRQGTNFTGAQLFGTTKVPAWFTLEDWQSGSTPNNCVSIVYPNNQVKQFQPFIRPYSERGQNAFTGYSEPFVTNAGVDLFGDGINGSHFGSKLSAIGGSIRKGEVTSSAPIRHAIKILLWAKLNLLYDANDASVNVNTGDFTAKGYRWPATTNDTGAETPGAFNYYGGNNSRLRMGALLAIEPNQTEGGLGLQTAFGKKLFHALQDYGAYVVDNTASDDVIFNLEIGAVNDFNAAYPAGSTQLANFKTDVIRLAKKLKVIDNNGPYSIGGGAGSGGPFGNGRRAPNAPSTFN